MLFSNSNTLVFARNDSIPNHQKSKKPLLKLTNFTRRKFTKLSNTTKKERKKEKYRRKKTRETNYHVQYPLFVCSCKNWNIDGRATARSVSNAPAHSSRRPFKHHKRLSRLFPAESKITEPRERGFLLRLPSRGIFCKIQCISTRRRRGFWNLRKPRS